MWTRVEAKLRDHAPLHRNKRKSLNRCKSIQLSLLSELRASFNYESEKRQRLKQAGISRDQIFKIVKDRFWNTLYIHPLSVGQHWIISAYRKYFLLSKRIVDGKRFIVPRFPETNSASGKFTRESLSDNFRSNRPLKSTLVFSWHYVQFCRLPILSCENLWNVYICMYSPINEQR